MQKMVFTIVPSLRYYPFSRTLFCFRYVLHKWFKTFIVTLYYSYPTPNHILSSISLWILFFIPANKVNGCYRLSIALYDIFYVFSKTLETDFIPVNYCLILSGNTKTPKFMQDKYLTKYFVHLRFHVDLNQQFLSWKSSSPSLIYNRKRKNTQQLQHFPPIF